MGDPPGACGARRTGPGREARSPFPHRFAYATGPWASVTCAVWDVPDASVQAMVALSPGWRAASAAVRACGEAIVVPFTPVIVSPAARPAEAAGPPSTTPAMGAPA